jgi:hypothetical protein
MLVSLEFSSYQSMFDSLEPYFSNSHHILFLSRLDHRTLASYIGFDRMKVYWLTKREGPLNLKPHLQDIEHCIKMQIDEVDFIAFEGLDWLFELYPETDVYAFISNIGRSLQAHQKCVFLLSPLTFTPIQYARIRRFAPSLSPLDINVNAIHSAEISSIEHSISFEIDQNDSSLRMLTTLPKLGFNRDHIAKRMLQWKRMGFDVSELQPALSMSDMDHAYRLYMNVEKKVRLAIELIREVEAKSNQLDVKTIQRSMYNLFQLENFDDVEKWIA